MEHLREQSPHTKAPVGFKPRILVDLDRIANVRPPCCCVSAGCQGNRAERSLGFGLSGWSTSGFFPPLHLCPLSSLSSATGAAGGRWWVFCSIATPSVDGD